MQYDYVITFSFQASQPIFLCTSPLQCYTHRPSHIISIHSRITYGARNKLKSSSIWIFCQSPIISSMLGLHTPLSRMVTIYIYIYTHTHIHTYTHTHTYIHIYTHTHTITLTLKNCAVCRECIYVSRMVPYTKLTDYLHSVDPVYSLRGRKLISKCTLD